MTSEPRDVEMSSCLSFPACQVEIIATLPISLGCFRSPHQKIVVVNGFQVGWLPPLRLTKTGEAGFCGNAS